MYNVFLMYTVLPLLLLYMCLQTEILSFQIQGNGACYYYYYLYLFLLFAWTLFGAMFTFIWTEHAPPQMHSSNLHLHNLYLKYCNKEFHAILVSSNMWFWHACINVFHSSSCKGCQVVLHNMASEGRQEAGVASTPKRTLACLLLKISPRQNNIAYRLKLPYQYHSENEYPSMPPASWTLTPHYIASH